MVAPDNLGLDLTATVGIPRETPARLVQSAVLAAGEAGFPAVIAPAGWLAADGGPEPGGPMLVAACGYPTGRHHDLVVASEARLAVQFGAGAVVVALDPAQCAPDEDAALRRLVVCRGAVSDQVELCAAVPVGPGAAGEDLAVRVAQKAAQAGADAVRFDPAPLLGATANDTDAVAAVLGSVRRAAAEVGEKIAVRATIANTASTTARELLMAGARRVDTPDPWALTTDAGERAGDQA